jgi:hypothetical protein
MFAGKHMSATHVASSDTKFMGNGGQHAIATAAAAHLCNKYEMTPRRVGERYLKELQDLAAKIAGYRTDWAKKEARNGGKRLL